MEVAYYTNYDISLLHFGIKSPLIAACVWGLNDEHIDIFPANWS